ncbi:MAG: ankyrin repeat domain-containing protein, partial [Planctomycetota bacterium]
IDVNIKNDNGMTPLHFAVTNYTFEDDHLDMVMFLVAHGAAIDAKDQMGRTPLNVVTNTVVMSSGKEPLEYRIAKFLISKGADINAKHEDGWTALHWAVGTAQKDLVELLIAKGAKINSTDWKGETPLYWAVHRHVDAEERLSRNDADIIAKTKIKDTARLESPRQTMKQYYLTMSNTLKDVSKLLIANGADVNAKNNDGDTPLIEAAKGADKELVGLLVASGADVNAKGRDDLTAVDNAAQQGRTDIVKFLLAKDADIGPSDKAETTPLHLAAEQGKKDMVEFWIAKGANVNAKNEHGVTPLGLAVGGHRDIAKLPQAKDSRGYFKRADYFYWRNEFDRAIEDYTSTCRLDPENDDAIYRRGRAWAKKGNSEQAVVDWKKAIELNWRNALDIYYTRRLLKSPDAQLDRLIKEVAERHLDDLDRVSGYSVGYGGSPGYFYTLSLIISKPFEEDKFLKMVRNDNPVTRGLALICLARQDIARYRETIESFYADNAEVEFMPFGCIVTHITLDKLAKRILEDRYLLNFWFAHHTDAIRDKFGVFLKYKDEAGDKNGVIKSLIANRADVNTKDQDGETPLHYAAEHGDKHVAELLIANGADVNAKNNNDETPLHCATRWGYKDVIKLLIANGADIDLKTKAGSTALQIATEMDYQGLSSLLRKHGAKD